MSTLPPPLSPYDARAQRRLSESQIRDSLRSQRSFERRALRQTRQAARLQLRQQRSASILGPLLAIAFGIGFLLVQANVVPRSNFYHFARLWPLVLIFAGLIILIEWLVDRYRTQEDKPQIRRTVGFWPVLLLSTFIGTGLFGTLSESRKDFFLHGFAITPDNIDEFLGDKHESDSAPVDYALPPGATVTVNNPHGNVTVTGVSTDGQMHLAIHRQVYSRSDEDAADKYKKIEPRFSTSGNAVSLNLQLPDGAAADLNLTVPASSAMSIIANHGDVSLTRLRADANITANRGNITLASLGGNVSAHLNNGDSDLSAREVVGSLSLNGHAHDISLSDIGGTVSLAGEFFGATHLEHVDAPLSFHTSRTSIQLARLEGEMAISPDARLSADGISGPISISTRDRNITLERVAGNVNVVNENGSVDVALLLPLGNVTIANHNGSASVTLPEHAGFGYNAETTDGAILNDFTAQTSSPSRDHNVESGTIGSGTALVRIASTHGDVTLRKSALATTLPITRFVPHPRDNLAFTPPAPPIPPGTPPSASGSTIPTPQHALQLAQAELDKAINDTTAAATIPGIEGEQSRRIAGNEVRKAAADLKKAARDEVEATLSNRTPSVAQQSPNSNDDQ